MHRTNSAVVAAVTWAALLASTQVVGASQQSPRGAASAATSRPPSTTAPTPAETEFFENKIRPLFAEHYNGCHGGRLKQPMSGLSLGSRAAMLKGGLRGPAAVPGDAEKSLLMVAVGYREQKLQMPPQRKLPEPKIALLEEWVKMGAPWPAAQAAGSDAQPTTRNSKLKTQDPQPTTRNSQLLRSHWAFQPFRPIALPVVKHASWVRTPVDAFILAGLEAKGLMPAPTADRYTLLRRVKYDLTGLPPTPDEIDAFVADRSPDAYEKVVDRLLASPRYGERWARHWLDLVRYAETDGHEFDLEKPTAHEYRDYVIRALNADVPYDQFVREHIAGDLLRSPRLNATEGFNESIIGTGFWFLGEGTHSPVDLREDEAGRIDNQIDVFSKTFVGLSVGCARCHDHKFDPIPTADYYALSGYLKSSRYQIASIIPPEPVRRVAAELAELRPQLENSLLSADTAARQTAAARSAEYLKASAVILGSTADPLPTPADVAAERKLDPAQLEKWIRYLRDTSARKTSDPLHPWVTLASRAASATPEGFAKARADLLEKLRAESETEPREASSGPRSAQRDPSSGIVVFEEFDRPSYPGWFVTGEAFGAGPTTATSLRIPPGKEPRIEGLLPSGLANSGAVADRLHGTLRSEAFTITKPNILYRMAGKDAQVNLIIDGFQRIRDPIYGRLTIALKDGGALRWHRQDVAKWIGERAYLEITDPWNGWIALDRILFSEKAAPSDKPDPAVTALLAHTGTSSLDALASGYGRLFQEVLTGAHDLADGNTAVRKQATGVGQPETRNSKLETRNSSLADWLLRSDLFPGTATARSGSELAKLLDRRDSLENAIPYARRAIAITDGTPEDDRVHIRGSHKTPGPPAPRRILTALGGSSMAAPTRGSGRFELSERLAAHPLLARVMVNRVWRHHFGEGIVRTPDDFGIRGELPSNPALLEWLARSFSSMEFSRAASSPQSSTLNPQPSTLNPQPSTPSLSWSLKRLHRMVVLSSAYRMRSTGDPRSDAVDPVNRLFHKMPVRRLEAEAIRDGILAVSGRLDVKMGGAGVMPYLTSFLEGRGRPAASGPLDGDGRRSIYLGVRRNFLNPMFLAFDFPIPFTTIGRRSVSSVPAQALTLMNNPFVVQQAEVWAKRMLARKELSSEHRIREMYLSAYGRPPTAAETAAALAFVVAPVRSSALQRTPETRNGADEASQEELKNWSDLCHVLFNVKEFIFVN